jgi:hypothetical protein
LIDGNGEQVFDKNGPDRKVRSWRKAAVHTQDLVVDNE